MVRSTTKLRLLLASVCLLAAGLLLQTAPALAQQETEESDSKAAAPVASRRLLPSALKGQKSTKRPTEPKVSKRKQGSKLEEEFKTVIDKLQLLLPYAHNRALAGSEKRLRKMSIEQLVSCGHADAAKREIADCCLISTLASRLDYCAKDPMNLSNSGPDDDDDDDDGPSRGGKKHESGNKGTPAKGNKHIRNRLPNGFDKPKAKKGAEQSELGKAKPAKEGSRSDLANDDDGDGDGDGDE